MKKILAALLTGFIGGVVVMWIYMGPDPNADDSTVRFARSVETISDSVITLELMESRGCEAVADFHERRLKNSVKETGSLIGDLANVDELTPDLDEQLNKVRDWASEQNLDELVDGSKKLIDKIRN